MEEKKLDKDMNVRSKQTDEEIAEGIINALKKTKKTLEDLREEDDDYDKLSLLKKINNSSLWLIQRLLGIVDNLRDKNAELQKQVNEYKNKTEQGTLIELPFIIKCSTKYAVVVARSGRGRRLYKTVTMPIDEAEAILKAMKEKKEKSDE